MKRLEWIEAMRGLAACWVVLTHAETVFRAFLGGPKINFLANGYFGVDFFFVLSGFIIAKSSAELHRRGGGLREYATARALRIYVPYLPVGIGIYLLYLLFPSISKSSQEGVNLLTSATLLPAGRPALSVAWSLVSEVIFYAIFSLFFVSRRALLTLLGVWVVAIAAAWAVGLQMSIQLSYVLNPVNLWFVLGICVAWLTRRGITDRTALVCLVAGLGLVGSQAFLAEPNRVLLGPGFALLVAAACAPWALRVPPGPFLMLLGAASYSIYLVHYVTLSAAVRVFQGQNRYLALVAIILLAVGAGVMYHLLYERRMLRWARFKASAAARSAVPASAR